MRSISEQKNRFLIDVNNERVYCRSCRKVCKRLDLPEFIQYWCANHDCDNSEEVVLTRDGAWKVYSVVEVWFGNMFSRYSSKLLAAETSGEERP